MRLRITTVKLQKIVWETSKEHTLNKSNEKFVNNEKFLKNIKGKNIDQYIKYTNPKTKSEEELRIKTQKDITNRKDYIKNTDPAFKNKNKDVLKIYTKRRIK